MSYSIRPRGAGENYYFLVHHQSPDQGSPPDQGVVQNANISDDESDEDEPEHEAPEAIEMQVFSSSE